MIFHKVLLISAILVALVIIYFFFIGLADGSVDAQNFRLWMLFLLVVVLVIGGGIWLERLSYLKWSNAVLAVLAIPGWLYAFYILLVIFTKQRWN